MILIAARVTPVTCALVWMMISAVFSCDSIVSTCQVDVLWRLCWSADWPNIPLLHWADKHFQMETLSQTLISVRRAIIQGKNSRKEFLPYQLSYCRFCANQRVVRKINSCQAVPHPVLRVVPNVSFWFDWPHTQVTIWRREQGAVDGQARRWLHFMGTKIMLLSLFNFAHTALLLC
jgi:hypothetical protein